MLSPADKQRFARQLLLPEIGERGQAKLCAATVALPPSAEPRAAAVARDYLARAGLQTSSDEAASNALVDRAALRAFAGESHMEEAAAALLGAFFAVEAIKAELVIGTAAQKLSNVTWTTEQAP